MDNMRAGLGLQHIGIIMDGNGRWAKKRGLPRKYGHREGAKAFRRIVEYCDQTGIALSDRLCLFHRKLEAPRG